MRLIDADALKEVINLTCFWEQNDYGMVKNIIDNAPTIEQKKEIVPVCKVTFDKEQLQEIVDKKVAELVISAREWIPVSERLPAYTGLYLISVDDLVTVANFTGTYFMRKDGSRIKVYAWQPLPEPYKKGAEK